MLASQEQAVLPFAVMLYTMRLEALLSLLHELPRTAWNLIQTLKWQIVHFLATALRGWATFLLLLCRFLKVMVVPIQGLLDAFQMVVGWGFLLVNQLVPPLPGWAKFLVLYFPLLSYFNQLPFLRVLLLSLVKTVYMMDQIKMVIVWGLFFFLETVLVVAVKLGLARCRVGVCRRETRKGPSGR